MEPKRWEKKRRTFFNPALVRKVRLERGWSRAQLAGFVGLSLSQIDKVEEGVHAFSLRRFQLFCWAAGLDYFQICDLLFLNPLPGDLVRRFRKGCYREGKTPNQVLEEFMRVYVAMD